MPKPKLIADEQKVVGKTIAAIDMHSMGANLVIAFTDGTYCGFNAVEKDDFDETYIEILKRLPLKDLGGGAIRLGLLTEAEVRSEWELWRKQQQSKEEAEARKKYEELRKRFGSHSNLEAT